MVVQKKEANVVGFREESIAPVSVKREVVWGGPACTVLATPARFKKKYPMNSDVFDGGFVRLFDPAVSSVCSIPMFLHGKNSGAVQRVLKAAKTAPVLLNVELVRNTYDDGRVKMTLDYRKAENAQKASHEVRVLNGADSVDGLIETSIPIEGHAALFVAVRIA